MSTTHLLASLSPAVPPNEPQIFDTHGKEINAVAGPFREGQEFFLSCQVTKGNPAPKVSWWHSGYEIPGTTHRSSSAVINNILIRSTPRDFYGTKFICKADVSPLVDAVQKEVTVHLVCMYLIRVWSARLIYYYLTQIYAKFLVHTR